MHCIYNTAWEQVKNVLGKGQMEKIRHSARKGTDKKEQVRAHDKAGGTIKRVHDGYADPN